MHRRFIGEMRALGRKIPGSRFLSDRSGVTTVELAMIGVPFLGLLCAIFETGFVYLESVQLQVATQTAARAVLTGSAGTSMTNQAFANSVCNNLTKMFNCALLQVSITSPASWAAASTQEGTNTFLSTGYSSTATINLPASGNIAVVQVAYPMPQVVAILAGGVVMGSQITQVHAGQTSVGGTWSNILIGTYAFIVEPP